MNDKNMCRHFYELMSNDALNVAHVEGLGVGLQLVVQAADLVEAVVVTGADWSSCCGQVNK